MKTQKQLLTVSLAIATILFCACNKVDVSSIVTEDAAVLQIPSRERDATVTPSDAAILAELFANSADGIAGMATKVGTKRSSKISSSATVREDGQDLMYIFNYEDGGWVIVGSTREYYPILAYSDKGKFELQDDMGPVDVWLDGTKVSIKHAAELCDEEKDQMRSLWSHYEDADLLAEKTKAVRVQTKSAGEDACWERIETVQSLYGSEGWTFTSVSAAEQFFTDMGLSSYYSDICYSASQNHSALNETVIGYRFPAVNQVGPLLSTTWHQYAPFNSQCPNQYPAGSGVIAAAQVMKYYEEPSYIPMLDGTYIYWSDIPDSPNTTPNKIPQLIARLGQIFYANYGSSVTITTPANVEAGLSNYYDVADKTPETSYRTWIFNSHNPVIMYGYKTSSPGAEPNLWVCDGVRQAVYNQVQFFTENQPYGAGSFTQGMYTYTNPGLIGQPVGTIIYTYYMKWGLQGEAYNGWFSANYNYSSPLNYNYNKGVYGITPLSL